MSELDFTSHDPQATAFHETGHTFLLVMLERPYTHVEILEVTDPNEVGAIKGITHYTYPDPTPNDPPLDKVIHACICFAGSVAEDRYRKPDAFGAHGLSLIEGGWEDLTKYKSLKLPKDSFLPLLSLTAKIVHKNWSLIERIANSLNEKRRLSAEEVGQLLASSNLEENRQLYLTELDEIIRSENIS